jgi:hypothetical protein
MDLKEAKLKLAALKALRGQHDQKIRCGVIDIVYGPTTTQRPVTLRFLETEIHKFELIVLEGGTHDHSPM